VTYEIKPWPYGGRQVLVTTQDPAVEDLLRSLEARYSRLHGWFLSPSRARVFEALLDAEVVPLGDRNYRFPDGVTRHIYDATRYLRETTGRKVTA
jgi:hypothetical protein